MILKLKCFPKSPTLCQGEIFSLVALCGFGSNFSASEVCYGQQLSFSQAAAQFAAELQSPDTQIIWNENWFSVFFSSYCWFNTILVFMNV